MKISTAKLSLRRSPIRASWLIAALLVVACDGDNPGNYSSFTGPDAIIGSGSVLSESRTVSGFHGVALSGAGRALIDRGGFESLVVTADDNVLPHLTSEVVGGMLELGVAPGVSLQSTREITYEVGARTLDEIRISGAGDVEATGLATSMFRLDVSGAGNIAAFGRATEQDVTISGAGRYDGEGVASRVVTLNVSGAAFARVRASHELHVHVSGTAVVEYYGDPRLQVTGNGTVRRMGP